MNNADMARQQIEQLDRYLKWVKEEGGIEAPTHLSTWFKPQQIKRLEWLKRNCIGKILEAGCNWGYVLAYCGGHIGVDWNPKSLELARILSPEGEFIEADIRHIPLADGSVDTFMLCDVLEHLPWVDVPLAIHEAKRIARRQVLVTIPNGENNTAEALSLKHQWLCDKEKIVKIMEILGVFGNPYEMLEITENFIFFKAYK